MGWLQHYSTCNAQNVWNVSVSTITTKSVRIQYCFSTRVVQDSHSAKPTQKNSIYSIFCLIIILKENMKITSSLIEGLTIITDYVPALYLCLVCTSLHYFRLKKWDSCYCIRESCKYLTKTGLPTFCSCHDFWIWQVKDMLAIFQWGLIDLSHHYCLDHHQ